MAEPRTYRRRSAAGRLSAFTVTLGETDLWIGVDPGSHRRGLEAEVRRFVSALRGELLAYIAERPLFRASYEPLADDAVAPPLARAMLKASRAAGVGPMAAVAGAFSDTVCDFLVDRLGCAEAAVENGGDDALRTREPCSVLLLAGASPLSGRLSFELGGAGQRVGVATSAGRVGHSYSVGRADACLALAADAATADAFATAFGNRLSSPADLEPALRLAARTPGLFGLAAVLGDRFGCIGALVPRPTAAAAAGSPERRSA